MLNPLVRAGLLLMLAVPTGAQVPVIGAHEQYVPPPITEPRRSRALKIKLTYQRAGNVAEMFGGSTAGPRYDAWSKPGFGGPATALLPDGIETVFGYDVDNTIYAVGSHESLLQILGIIASLDVPSRSIRLAARAALSVSPSRGSAISLRAEGGTIADAPLHLKSALSGPVLAGAGAELVSATSDVDIAARIRGDGSVIIDADWYVDLTWRVPGSARPIRLNTVYRTHTLAQDRREVMVTTASVQLPHGAATLSLRLTPTLLPDRKLSPP